MLKNEAWRYSLLIVLLGGLFFIPFNGGVHLFDWDEINFAEISREMLLTGEFNRVQINFEPFFQKPPLFFWLQALSMQVFGINEFAARFTNAVCGILTLLIIFLIGRKLFNLRFGLLWAGTYFCSVLPFLYFKSGIIDPWFNLFIFLGIYFLILFVWKKENVSGPPLPRASWTYLLLGGLFIGLATITKGQAAYLIAVLTLGVYWVSQRFRMYISIPQFLVFTLVTVLVMAASFGWETLKNGPEFVQEFFVYQYRLFSTPDAGHKGFPGYHFVVVLLGCFPASIFALRAFGRTPGEDAAYQQDFRRWMKYLFWVVLLLFTVVQSKIIHYSSMCYFPLTFLAATVMDKILDGKMKQPAWVNGLLWGIGGLYVLVIFLLPWLGQNPEELAPLFDDPFARGNLEAEVRWTGWEVLPGILLLALLGYSHRARRRGSLARSWMVLFGGMPIFIMLCLFFFVGRIESYSQRAAVEFFEELAGEEVRAMTYGYKSYVPLFYGRPQEGGLYCFKDAECENQLLRGPVERPAYIITKVHKAGEIASIPGLEKIGEKNGFVFFRRMPSDSGR